MKSLNTTVLAIAAAAAFGLAPVTAIAGEGKVVCSGVNGCKGKSGCKTAESACKGQNACKGKGVMKMSKAKCLKKGGTVVEPNAAKPADASTSTSSH